MEKTPEGMAGIPPVGTGPGMSTETAEAVRGIVLAGGHCRSRCWSARGSAWGPKRTDNPRPPRGAQSGKGPAGLAQRKGNRQSGDCSAGISQASHPGTVAPHDLFRLVDADCLDTERRFNQGKAETRAHQPNLEPLWERFQARRHRVAQGASGPVNQVRCEALHGPSGIRLHPVLPGGGRERAGHPAAHPQRARPQGRPHLHRRGLGPEHAPSCLAAAPGDAPARRRRRGATNRPPGPEPHRGSEGHRGAARPGDLHPLPCGGPGHRRRRPHVPAHAAHAALPGRVGA